MDLAEAEKKIAQLREEIREHDRLYYQDTAPIISAAAIADGMTMPTA